MSDSGFLSPQQLAAELNVPVSTVYAWRQKGVAPRAIRVGRHLRFARRSVDLWLEQHSDQPQSTQPAA